MEENEEGAIVDATVDAGRRKAMCKIAVGVGVLAGYSMLPEQWTKPIIGQIVLPAHAGTSGSSLHDPCTVTLTAGDQGTTSVTVLVSGFVTPPTNNVPIHIVAGATGGANQLADADTQTDEDGNYSVSLTLGGGPNITGVAVTTTATGAEGAAECSVDIGASTEVNGNFSGIINGIILGETSNQTGKQIGELIAVAGKSVGDFFISDAYAVTDDSDLLEQHICTNITGTIATFSFYHTNGQDYILSGSGSINQRIGPIPDGDGDFYITFLEVKNQYVIIRLERNFEHDGPIMFRAEGQLDRTEVPCQAPV